MRSLNLFSQVFDSNIIRKLSQRDNKLANVLRGNYEAAVTFRKELESWLKLFHALGWFSESLKSRLRNVADWFDFYSAVNELRAAYFLEAKLKLTLTDREPSGACSKKVDFRGRLPSGIELYVEVKTPIKKDRDVAGFFDASQKVERQLRGAANQLPRTATTLVLLSDDLDVTLFHDRLAKRRIHDLFGDLSFNNISAVGLLGNIYIETMYKFEWAVNSKAVHTFDTKTFSGFQPIGI